MRNEHIKSNLSLWAQERADFRNAFPTNFTINGVLKRWSSEDFTDPAGSAQRWQRTQDEHVQEVKMKLAASREINRIAEAKRTKEFTAVEEELDIPAWARMTPEEKAARNGR